MSDLAKDEIQEFKNRNALKYVRFINCVHLLHDCDEFDMSWRYSFAELLSLLSSKLFPGRAGTTVFFSLLIAEG